MAEKIKLKKESGDDFDAALDGAVDVVINDSERQPCEIWTRVMGYFRPVSAFNIGKKGEYAERVCFKEEKAVNHE